MSLKKTREFLEYYRDAARHVPAGDRAAEALREIDGVERALIAWRDGRLTTAGERVLRSVVAAARRRRS